MHLKAIRQFFDVCFAPNVSGIDANLVNSVFKGADGDLMIKMNIRNQRHRAFVDKRANGLYAKLVIHAHAYDFTTRPKKRVDLSKRLFRVPRIGIGHRLNGNRRASAKGQISDRHFSRTHAFSLPLGQISFGIPI